MAISARLSRTLRQELGDEAGEDLVNWMVQMETNRSDLREMMDGYMARLDRQFEGIEARFAAMDRRFDGIDARFDKVDERFEKVDQRFEQVHRDVAALETRIAHRFTDLFRWSFVFWCGAVGAIALLAKALR
jgi:archaellum component FlaC